jgi:hypothetical protein
MTIGAMNGSPGSTESALSDLAAWSQPGDLLEYAPSSVAEEAAVADQAPASSAAGLPLKRPLDAVSKEA